jgi:hypothetical protein
MAAVMKTMEGPDLVGAMEMAEGPVRVSETRIIYHLLPPSLEQALTGTAVESPVIFGYLSDLIIFQVAS